MPIYAYRCAACGAEQDALQKFSDPPLTVCPACGAESLHRVLTAPAFQLKGSGWYVTDFRDGNKSKQSASNDGGGASKPDDTASAAKAEGAKPDAPTKSADSPAASAGGSAATGPAAD